MRAFDIIKNKIFKDIFNYIIYIYNVSIKHMYLFKLDDGLKHTSVGTVIKLKAVTITLAGLLIQFSIHDQKQLLLPCSLELPNKSFVVPGL